MDNKTTIRHKIKEKIKDNRKVFNITLIALSILVVTVFSLLLYKNNNGNVNILYRYQTVNGWSKWYKVNEKVDNSNEEFIVGIEFKNNTTLKGNIEYKVKYYDETWTCLDKTEECKSKEGYYIYGITTKLSGDLSKKYDLCYRVIYDGKKSKWACSGEEAISKNNKAITGIEYKTK